MVTKIPDKQKRQTIREWISGKSRDEIAKSLGLGSGTVTNIIRDWKKQLYDRDYDAVRELAVESKQKGLSLKEASDVIRLYNIVKSHSIKGDDIEDFITDLSGCIDDGVPAAEIMKAASKLFALSGEEKMLPEKVPELLRHQVEELKEIESKISMLREEKKRVDEERLTALNLKEVTVPAIEKYISLHTILKQHNFSLDNVSGVTAMLENFEQFGNDPSRILAKFSKITDLEHEESELEKRNDLLQKQVNDLDKVIKDKQDYLHGLNTQAERFHSGVASLGKIKARGVKDQDVISLGKIIESYEHAIDTGVLQAEMKDFKSFAVTNTKLEIKNKELAANIEKLSSQIVSLEVQKDKLNSQIEMLWTTTKKTLEEIGATVIDQLKAAGATAIDQLRGLPKEIGNATNMDSEKPS